MWSLGFWGAELHGEGDVRDELEEKSLFSQTFVLSVVLKFPNRPWDVTRRSEVNHVLMTAT